MDRNGTRGARASDRQRGVSEAQQSDDIIRVAAYQRQQFRDAVVSLDSATAGDASSLATPFTQKPVADLGFLDRLPLELLQHVVGLMDIASLLALGQVNRHGRDVVLAIREYQVITRYALDALRVLLRTKIATYFSAVELCRAIHERDCRHCGDFAGFLFLPTISRRCFACISVSPGPEFVPISTVRSVAGLTDKQLSSIPVLHTIPGVYTTGEVRFDRRLELVTRSSVLQVAQERASEVALALASQNIESHRAYRFLSATALPFVDPNNFEVQHGLCCRGCQDWFSRINRARDSRRDATTPPVSDRVYSEDTFMRHFRQCSEARNLWDRHKNGAGQL